VAATTVASLNFAVIVDLRLLSLLGANPPEELKNIETSLSLSSLLMILGG
jgi:hypothetical protein